VSSSLSRTNAVLRALCAALPLALCAGAHAQLDTSHWIPAIISGPGDTLGADPALSDSGDVYFSSSDATGSGLFSSRAGGPILTVIGKNFGLSSFESPSANSSGDVAFLATDATGPALYRHSGAGVLLTLRGDDFGASSLSGPTTNDSGEIAFTAIDDATGHTGVYARSSGGTMITIHGENFGNLAPKQGSARLSSSGRVTFAATDVSSGGEGVFARSTGGGNLLTIQGANLGQLRGVSSNGADDVVFIATDAVGTDSAYSVCCGGFSGTIPTLPPGGLALSAVNDNGIVALGYDSAGGRSASALELIGVTDVTGSFFHTVASMGDIYEGRTVASLSFSDAGLNNSDDLAFHAEFDDGTSGVFLVNIPAPGAGAALVLATGAILSRRRR